MNESYLEYSDAKSGSDFVGFSFDIKDNKPVTYIAFPLGYGSENIKDEDLFPHIRKLISVLLVAKSEGVLPYEDSLTSSFPIYDYMYVLEYFISHNYEYYKETEIKYGAKESGKISWKRTIKNIKPNISEDNDVIYLDTIRRYSSLNDDNLITTINAYCVSMASKLVGSFYGDLLVEDGESPDEETSKIWIDFLNHKISQTNLDNNKRLFSSMIAIISNETNRSGDERILFGTSRFHLIWERMVDATFGRLTDNNKNDFYPAVSWEDSSNSEKSSYLRPDTIYINDNKVYVIDAKYYRYGLNHDLKLLPGSSDVIKQITYVEFLKSRYKGKYEINEVSPFIVPTYNKRVVVEKSATAKVDWNNSDVKVVAVLLDSEALIDTYLNGSSRLLQNELIGSIS